MRPSIDLDVTVCAECGAEIPEVELMEEAPPDDLICRRCGAMLAVATIAAQDAIRQERNGTRAATIAIARLKWVRWMVESGRGFDEQAHV